MTHTISAQNVSLDYPIYDTVNRSLTRSITANLPIGGTIKAEAGKRLSVLALDAVSFELVEGDRVALLGHNGAGKTSLLKVLSGFYEPTKGSVATNGVVSALLDLGSGMDMHLTGYENIELCGLLRGISKHEMKPKVAGIAEFSELGSYLDLPVRMYSRGMIMRLAFSIAAEIECDIMLLDEWFGAGDQSFVDKARERLSEMAFNSSTLVFATHAPDVAKKLCNKGMFLEHGKLLMFGEIDEVVKFQVERRKSR